MYPRIFFQHFADVRIRGYRVLGTKCSPGLQENTGTLLDPGWRFSSGRGNYGHTMCPEVNTLPIVVKERQQLFCPP